MSTRGSIALVVAFTAYWLIALPLDSVSTPDQQLLISVSAWLFLALALAVQSPAVRVQVITLVCVATVLEIIGSIVWGAYRYRLGNLPLFVPAGHGPFYLAALRTASLPLLRRNRPTHRDRRQRGHDRIHGVGSCSPSAPRSARLRDLGGVHAVHRPRSLSAPLPGELRPDHGARALRHRLGCLAVVAGAAGAAPPVGQSSDRHRRVLRGDGRAHPPDRRTSDGGIRGATAASAEGIA